MQVHSREGPEHRGEDSESGGGHLQLRGEGQRPGARDRDPARGVRAETGAVHKEVSG